MLEQNDVDDPVIETRVTDSKSKCGILILILRIFDYFSKLALKSDLMCCFSFIP